MNQNKMNKTISFRLPDELNESVEAIMKAGEYNFVSDVIRDILKTITGQYELIISTTDKKLINLLYVQLIMMTCIKDEVKRMLKFNPSRTYLKNLITALEFAYITIEQIISNAKDSILYPLTEKNENDVTYFAMVLDQLISNTSKKSSDFKIIAEKLKSLYNIELKY